MLLFSFCRHLFGWPLPAIQVIREWEINCKWIFRATNMMMHASYKNLIGYIVSLYNLWCLCEEGDAPALAIFSSCCRSF